jgi:phospholipid:diacylglycerol acyltransferase
MSGLRRRIFGTSSSDSPSLTPEQSREGTPTSEEVRVVSAKKLQALTDSHKKRGTKRRNAWIFGLGGLFGIIVAGFFASSNDVFDMQALKDMNLDSIMDVLPAGLIKDAQALQVPPLTIARPRLCSLHTGASCRKTNETPLHTIPLPSASMLNPKA